MHAVMRTYSGGGAKALADLLEKRKSDVEGVMRGVAGFKAYSLIRTADGCISVTVCADKAGADASVRTAAEWVRANAGDLKVSAPQVTEGSVITHIS